MAPLWLARRGCFSDTGFFFAVHNPSDRWHAECVALLAQIQQQGRVLVTTDFIVAETHALMVQRLGRDFALQWLDSLDGSVWIERATEADEGKAKSILRQYTDQDFTLTDATSFAVIERLGLPVALSTDRHFLAYGGKFIVLPLSGTKLPL